MQDTCARTGVGKRSHSFVHVVPDSAAIYLAEVQVQVEAVACFSNQGLVHDV
jgi:hypothetical protein